MTHGEVPMLLTRQPRRMWPRQLKADLGAGVADAHEQDATLPQLGWTLVLA
jgi:hypothetical protein